MIHKNLPIEHATFKIFCSMIFSFVYSKDKVDVET